MANKLALISIIVLALGCKHKQPEQVKSIPVSAPAPSSVRDIPPVKAFSGSGAPKDMCSSSVNEYMIEINSDSQVYLCDNGVMWQRVK